MSGEIQIASLHVGDTVSLTLIRHDRPILKALKVPAVVLPSRKSLTGQSMTYGTLVLLNVSPFLVGEQYDIKTKRRMISFSKRLSLHTPTQLIPDENKMLAFQEYEVENRHDLREHDDTKREADAHVKQQAGHQRGNARRPWPHQHREENQFKKEGSIREQASACRA